MSEDKKIIIDDDWKSQVAAEKEALKQAAAKSAEGAAASKNTASKNTASKSTASENAASETVAAKSTAGGQPQQMPPASLEMLISGLATEAMMAMGQLRNPASNESLFHPEQAKYAIDTLAILKEKTQGNLTPEEEKTLTDVLYQLRMMFVAVQQAPPAADS